MKLKELLSTLTTDNVQVSLRDLDTGSEIANLKASGYASLDDTIENREVKQWLITSATAIQIILGDVLEGTNDNTNTGTGG